MKLSRGVVTFSFDFELIWGTRDLAGPEGFRRACQFEREHVVDRLLSLLEDYEVSATWCVLGHLMLSECSPVEGRKHPEIVRPTHAWHPNDWFKEDPCGNEQTHPTFYGRSLVENILTCRVEQEVGCHSFSHTIFGDPGCSRETAASEIARCVELARGLGIELHSFAFPRNRVGHLDVLREHGFVCFRGAEPTWHRGGGGTALSRLGHLADLLSARCPPVSLPERTGEGLLNAPASMMYFPMHGPRRYIPLGARVRRARKGLERAAREQRLFHLWCHPTNFADEAERMFDGFERILQRTHELRAEGRVEVLPMGALANAVTEQ